MSDPKQKFYLTTPIYYVNARPHIGHAYTTIVADILARRHRLLGEDTFFLTGTDEHGQKIERSAAVAGIPPQQFADQVSKTFEDLWKRMGITNDDYIRTTSEKHKKGAQKLFEDLFKQGYIYLDTYTGAYCVSDETFVDVQPGEPCPDCGRITETVTEENFFFKLSSFQRPLLDLIESGTVKIENEARRNEVLSFLLGPVSTLEKDGFVLVPQVAATARDIRASKTSGEFVRVEQLSHTANGTSYVAGALRDLSVSRSSFKWGIPVPQSVIKSLPTLSKDHVIYVWLDALANYMTAIGYGSDSAADEAKFKKYWPADLHLVGKEIIRFHCVYWPAFLLALNPKLRLPNATKVQDKGSFAIEADLTDVPLAAHKEWAKDWLPKAITAHGWLLFDNSKMSKSKGNIVRTETILDAFGNDVYGKQFPDSTKPERDLFASDVLRYFLLREIPFGQDGSFSFDALITRYNADLANGYGNLVARVLTTVIKAYGGEVPSFAGRLPPLNIPVGSGVITRYVWGSEHIRQYLTQTIYVAELKFDRLQFSAGRQRDLATETTSLPEIGPLSAKVEYGYLDAIWSAIEITNGFFSGSQPWTLIDQPTPALASIIYQSLESIRIITALLYPVMPNATAKVWLQLGLGDIETAAKNGELANLQWGGLKPGTKLGPLSPIFPRADKSLAETMINMENPETPRPDAPLKSASTPTPAQPVTTDRLDPAAPPRSFTEAGSATHVAGSAAHTTHNGPTPSHTEATPSAPFNTPAAQAPGNAGPADASAQITIDDFIKIDLRVAQIVVAERIPKADKLLRLEVDLGYEKRQILSGIAEFYTPEELIGRRIVVIANLAPRKMRGLESHGMLLAASHGENGKPILATFGEDIALGSRLK